MLYLNGINRRMRLRTVFEYLKAIYKKDMQEELQRDYNSEMLYVNATLTYKAHWEKDFKMKSWSDIKNKANKPIEKERTAEEIEEEVTKQFENWR